VPCRLLTVVWIVLTVELRLLRPEETADWTLAGMPATFVFRVEIAELTDARVAVTLFCRFVRAVLTEVTSADVSGCPTPNIAVAARPAASAAVTE